jgi:hypothetical protein
VYNSQFDSYEFIHTLNGTQFRQGVSRSQVLTYTLIEDRGEIVGLRLYVAAIVVDPKTGVGVSATYKLDADEAAKFRDWWLWG